MRRAKDSRITTESYLVSVSDLMAALLFFFIIALAAMVLHYNRQIDRWSNVEKDRRWLLGQIARDLQNAGIQVEFDPDLSILRLPNEVLFARNEFLLGRQARANSAVLRSSLLRWVPCLTPRCSDFSSCVESHRCPPDSFVDTFLIEGHTDSDPVEWDPVRGNWRLSSQRAISLYLELIKPDPDVRISLGDLTNSDGHSLFAVSGYADTRPACDTEVPDEECKSRNRRIVFRFIVVPAAMYNSKRAAR